MGHMESLCAFSHIQGVPPQRIHFWNTIEYSVPKVYSLWRNTLYVLDLYLLPLTLSLSLYSPHTATIVL